VGISEAAAQEAVGEAEAEAEAEVEVEVKVEAGDSVNGAQTGDLMVLVWLKMAKRKSKYFELCCIDHWSISTCS
jgi:hypothetical protein